MKKIFIAAALVLLAASCHNQSYNDQQSSQGQSATSSPADPTAGWNSYNSPDKYGFQVKYSNDFGFSTDYSQVQALSYLPSCDQDMVACAFLKKENYSGTNFDGAGVSININPTLNTEAKCYNFAVSTNEAQTPVADVTINGTTFKSATGGGGAAGHFDKVQVYRNFHNNMCYEIAQHMVETQVANYPAGTVTQIDENAVWSKLQGVINTFNFTSATSATNPTGAAMVISMTGTTVCLPHKNVQPGQPQTMECAIGFKNDATGKFYSLKNTNPPFYDTGVKVKVTGTLVDDSNSNYDVVGGINGAAITKI